MYFLLVGSIVAVELSQGEFLQFDLQLLVLPLQVHNHTVQEVDLMETIETQTRSESTEYELFAKINFGKRPDGLTCPSANSFSSLSCSRAASPAGEHQKQKEVNKKKRTCFHNDVDALTSVSSPEGGASVLSPSDACVPPSLCSRL